MAGLRAKLAAAAGVWSVTATCLCLALGACDDQKTTYLSSADAAKGEGSTSDPTTPGSCEGPTTCPNAPMLGVISGDSKDGGTLRMTGQNSGWVLVRATEDLSSWTGEGMKLRATLSPPAGATYDLVAHFNAAGTFPDGGYLPDAAGAIDCEKRVGSATSSGDNAVLDLAWGEPSDGGSANGLEDGRTIALEVRHVMGSCGIGGWTLEVRRP